MLFLIQNYHLRRLGESLRPSRRAIARLMRVCVTDALMEEYFYGFRRVRVVEGADSEPLNGTDRARSLFFLVSAYRALCALSTTHHPDSACRLPFRT